MSSTLALRDYQIALLDDISTAWSQGHRNVLAQLPTGGGKTVVFSHAADFFTQQGQTVLVLAHRTELITQAASKLSVVCGAPVGIVKAGHRPDYSAPIQVASVQTVVRRLDNLPQPELVIIDEAHHATANTYRAILDHCRDAYQLGVTATPIRTDNTGFEDLFDSLVTGPTVQELINDGHLCKFKLFADPNPMTTAGARTQQGDYSAHDVAELNNAVQLSGSLVSSYQRYCPGQRCIVFAVNVDHSMAIADRYNAHGIPAAHLDGNSSPEHRQATLDAFARGDLLVLSNVGLFTEGFDLPALDAVQVARPTKSLGLWLQMLGRALRPSPGKDYAVLLDHTKNWAIHGTPTRKRTWSLQAVKQEGEPVLMPDGTIAERPPKPVVVEEPRELQEVLSGEGDEWEQLLFELVATCTAMGYKPGWLGYRLAEYQPPLRIWEKAAAILGYKPGWAWHQFQSQQRGTAAA